MAAASTDTAKAAQGKVIVSLGPDLVHDLDSIGVTMAVAAEDAAGIPIEFTRPQVIQACATKVLAWQDEQADAADTGE